MTYPAIDNLPPVHPGEILVELYLEPHEGSIAAFAKACEIDCEHISAIVDGHAAITAEVAARIAAALGTTTQYWLNLQSLYEAKKARTRADPEALPAAGFVTTLSRMARPLLYDRPMTAAERQRRRRGTQAPLSSDKLFLMTNLYPHRTNLPMTVWVSPRGGARHDVRIKVNREHGPKAVLDNYVNVAVRPEPHLVRASLPAADREAVFRWVTMNEKVLLDHWNGLIDGVAVGEQSHPLPREGGS